MNRQAFSVLVILVLAASVYYRKPVQPRKSQPSPAPASPAAMVAAPSTTPVQTPARTPVPVVR